jgi:hypothetical protein
MISGADLILDQPGDDDAVDFVVRGIRTMWPLVVFQEVSKATFTAGAELEFPARLGHEFLAYASPESFESWQRDGLTDDNGASMVHVLCNDYSLTVVVDRAGSDLSLHVREILEALRIHRLCLRRAA